MKLTGGQIVAEYLARQGMPHVIAIPGHGNLALCDAFIGRNDITMLPCMQEMAGVHMADGYYRVTGRPLAVFTSIGPGAVNTAIGVATAFVDSTPVLVVTGSAHTYMRGKGLLQEIERNRDADFSSVLQPIVKRHWRVDSPAQLPSIMHRAFNQMMTGRRGPVLIDLPMDVSAETANVTIPDPNQRAPRGRIAGDPTEVEAAARLLARARRPVILVGGGVRASGAEAALKELAQILGAAVVTTLMGKGSFPEDHPLAAWLGGSKGTTVGNAMTRGADVILAVGCRFADETASSFRHGVTFAIPPTRLIHVDVDPAEIGKNYPVEAGIVGDARLVLEQLIGLLRPMLKSRDYRTLPYFRELKSRRDQWMKRVKKLQDSRRSPVTISRALKEVRDALPADAFVVTSSGNVQAQLLQEFPFTVAGACVTTGGFSTMGFSLPAAIGVKIARPDRVVAALVGDGEFMMTMQEMATARQIGAAVVAVVFNNQGWIAIKDLQMSAFGRGRAINTDFTDRRGRIYSPDFQAAARAFGWNARKVKRPGEVGPAVKKAVRSGRPALVEVIVNREFPYSGSPAVGWWDVPIPEYLKQRRKRYEKERREERL
ncbi:MAG TPA: thiamine pyrophosphate-binding protein [bacterium]|nr:thiamine pyrophosphate-binding protein [bacterium]